MHTMKLSEDLAWRGFVNQTTYSSPTELDGEPITFYFGVDPSAPSMTIGNLASVMMVRKFMAHGHKAIILIGGATGMIGDPDGKKDERTLKSDEEIAKNKAGIIAQYRQLFGDMEFEVVDNYDWFKNINYLDFLRVVGKHVPMRQMLGREFVQSRLGEDGAGISYAEFSYVLIQAYDFLHLNKKKGATLQLSGADQWGNCIAGVDLIRRLTGETAHVWSIPLVVNKTTGVKFGKSEEGAIWLDPSLTSPYRFYQFWLNVDDEGVEEYLKIFTELDKVEVDKLIADFHENKAERLAQKTLAHEVTTLVHGSEVADSVKRVSEVLFGKHEYTTLTSHDFTLLKQELPVVKGSVSSDLVDLLVQGNLASSKGEARRFLEGNAVYINGQQIPLNKTTLEPADILHGHVVLRRGKNSQVIVQL